jgi:hypothetical protein
VNEDVVGRLRNNLEADLAVMDTVTALELHGKARAIVELRELAHGDDHRIAAAATTALGCAAEHGADPRMLLAVIRAAEHAPSWNDRQLERRRKGRGRRLPL